MPELKDDGKKPKDQNALVVNIKYGYDWSAYAEQFTADLIGNLALVCEVEEKDLSEEGDLKFLKAKLEESEAKIALAATSEDSFSSADSEQPKVHPRRPVNSWFVNSGCNRNMIGNHALLQDFKHKNGTHVAFGGDAGGKTTGEGTVSNRIISFDKVNYCAQLNFNMLSISQIYDKSYSTLFNDSFCYILKPGFKIANEWVVVKAPRDRDVYKLDMSQIDVETETSCLIAHASNDERIPAKKFSTNDLCSACLKGKQHRMPFKSKLENSISKPLQMLHMDLFGPTNVQSIGKKSYCLVIIDDFTRSSWVYFLHAKSEIADDDSDNDDDDLNSEYPFMSFRDPHVESYNQSHGPSISQEARESNNEADFSNQQNSPNDGGSVHNQPPSDPNGEVTLKSLDYFINSPEYVPTFTPHTSTILQDLPNLNESNLETQIQGEEIPTSRVHMNHLISYYRSFESKNDEKFVSKRRWKCAKLKKTTIPDALPVTEKSTMKKNFLKKYPLAPCERK
ncbi:hypothetical protein QVD17_19722 [Tagetes erecta]|uniref:Retrovirus-related Pol polyprotein from transposon TNT 1-94-like beta-barrel domain-containing protein n=1 Tax=Tagetes erecta TaxID=13708 RepID=A0AAD8KKB3_TARER|nr:hypothetical protein QVD17_19722 [Tagetes erecta]